MVYAEIMVMLIFLTVAVFLSQRWRKKAKNLSLCTSEQCIRCTKNKNVVENARSILKKDYRDIGRVFNAINETNSVYILYCEGLSSKSVWQLEDLPSSYQSDIELLKGNVDLFMKDFKKFEHPFHKQIDNESNDGWSKVYLVNQGVENKKNKDLHSETYSVLNACDNVIRDCIFGYIFYSVLHPNTVISEHNGPTNVRIRCHVSLKVPLQNKNTICKMYVDGTPIQWANTEIIFFDDSLSHSVEYSTVGEGLFEDRVLLIVDFWHPNLSQKERECIQNCYSPIGSK